MSRHPARWFVLLLWLCALPVFAQTRAWLDRDRITYGETVTLNIQTGLDVRQVDYRPLAAQFEIAGQTVRRSYDLVGGRATTRSLFAVGLRPRGPGVLQVPALRVGNASTAPLRLVVMPPTVQPANGDADAFVETSIDATQPYVQQAVGVVVRLHYAVPLLSGQLDQDPPAHASLQRVGEDVTYQREIGGRRYNVVERRFLLVPERSGPLVLPGARFNGQAAGGFFDQVFDDGRKPLSAAAPNTRLQVQAIPADAPQPWLPLHDLRLRYLQAPTRGRVGEAVTVEIEAQADGASAAQLPALELPASSSVQVFADPPQADERMGDGRPRTTLRRRIALVPLQPGALVVEGPRIAWWDASAGLQRSATLPPLRLQVAPGAEAAVARAPDRASGTADPLEDASVATAKSKALWWGLGMLLALVLAVVAWWTHRRRKTHATVAEPGLQAPSLAQALQAGDLAGIAQALAAAAGPGADLATVRARLDDAAQATAVARLQAARWGHDDAAAVLALLRTAFARGPRWRRASRKQVDEALPPLYPE